MDNLGFFAGPAESVFDLDVAAGIGRGDQTRAGCAKVAEFALQEPRRGLRLRDIIDARAAAAPRRLGALAQLDAGDRPQNFPRLRGNFLPVAEMAGLVIGHDRRSRPITNVQLRTSNIQRPSPDGRTGQCFIRYCLRN